METGFFTRRVIVMEENIVPQKQLSTKERIDVLEAVLLSTPQVPRILNHRFAPGLYSRELYMVKGSMWTSEEHKTKHQYIVLEGEVSVFTEELGEIFIKAPYIGITEPGTKRVLFIHENTRWITLHPTDITPTDDSYEEIEQAVSKIKDAIIGKHVNPYIENNIPPQIKNE